MSIVLPREPPPIPPPSYGEGLLEGGPSPKALTGLLVGGSLLVALVLGWYSTVVYSGALALAAIVVLALTPFDALFIYVMLKQNLSRRKRAAWLVARLKPERYSVSGPEGGLALGLSLPGGMYGVAVIARDTILAVVRDAEILDRRPGKPPSPYEVLEDLKRVPRAYPLATGNIPQPGGPEDRFKCFSASTDLDTLEITMPDPDIPGTLRVRGPARVIIARCPTQDPKLARLEAELVARQVEHYLEGGEVGDEYAGEGLI